MAKIKAADNYLLHISVAIQTIKLYYTYLLTRIFKWLDDYKNTAQEHIVCSWVLADLNLKLWIKGINNNYTQRPHEIR